ncbi:MAG: glycerol-3-phosphate 1-O-acyltransferase PlsY [Verrucomicrobiae bacterium]|nr:glycerol-3-phosphate 1-O-acyltransferase PlsY [Verrucomicrobiae bacterium]
MAEADAAPPLLMLAAVMGYLLGSVPFGLLLTRFAGLGDIRSIGSGNIGATNVLRVLGKPAGIFVLIADALKGALAVLLSPRLFHPTGPFSGWVSAEEAQLYLPLVAGIGAILGHTYTFWLGFRGGKGVATSAGVLGALVPVAFLITLATWILVIAVSRFVSLGSVVAAAILPLATAFTGNHWPRIALTAVIGLLVIWRHRANLQRLRTGTEPRLGAPRATPGEPAPTHSVPPS